MPRSRLPLPRLVLAISVLAGACSRAPTSPAPVVAEPAAAAHVPREATPAEDFVGVVAPEATARLSFPLAARVARVHVQVGSLVSVDAPIADLDTASLDADLAAAEASLGEADAGAREAQAAYAQARATARASRKLLARGMVSAFEARRDDASAARARGVLDAARAQVAERRAQLGKARELRAHAALVTPIAGRVAALAFEPGALAPAAAPVATVISTTRVIRFAAPPDAARALHEGDLVAVSVAPGAPGFAATVRSIAPRLDTAMQRVVVEATLADDATSVPEVGTRVSVRQAAPTGATSPSSRSPASTGPSASPSP